MSRNAWEHVNYYREHDVDPSVKRGNCWLTAAQEQKFEDYVDAGGRVLLHHDAIGFYLKGRAITRLAKAHFICKQTSQTITGNLLEPSVSIKLIRI